MSACVSRARPATAAPIGPGERPLDGRAQGPELVVIDIVALGLQVETRHAQQEPGTRDPQIFSGHDLGIQLGNKDIQCLRLWSRAFPEPSHLCGFSQAGPSLDRRTPFRGMAYHRARQSACELLHIWDVTPPRGWGDQHGKTLRFPASVDMARARPIVLAAARRIGGPAVPHFRIRPSSWRPKASRHGTQAENQSP